MRSPITVAGEDCFVTASVGIAMFPRDGESVVDLLRNADVAMYSVKAQGKNAAAMLRLSEAIEEYDDVQNFYSNFDFDEADVEATA